MVRNGISLYLLLSCIMLLVLSAGNVTGLGQPESVAPALPLKGHPNMSSALQELGLLARNGKWPEAEGYARRRGLSLQDGRLRVVLETEAETLASLTTMAEAMGFEIETRYRNLVQALVPIARLLDVAELPAVRFMRLPYQPRPLTVTSEGVALIAADVWHSAGYVGNGVKVAIIDLGFEGYSDLVAAGELPATLTVRSFRSDDDVECAEPHGAACAEIVYDVAPGVQLYLLNFETDVEFGNAVDYAIAEGVQVASCSLGWLAAGPFDGTGPICDIVDDAWSHDIFWAQAAGNSANKHWQGPWWDPDGNGRHNFASTDEMQSLPVSADTAIYVNLVWDDPWGAAGNDYDLYLYDDKGHELASSIDEQNGNDNPSESISYHVGPTGGGTYHVVIERFSAAGLANLELYSFRQTFEYQVASSSLLIPADAPGAVTAGAIDWATLQVENFSSRGPTNDGRLKPDFAAPDGVSSATYPGGFSGTSAAAPHLAGAAALVRASHPSFTATDTVTFLTQRAVDLGNRGPDYEYGGGLVSLGDPTVPLTNTGTISGTVFLQGRVRHGGVLVSVAAKRPRSAAERAEWVTTTTDSGLFVVPGLPAGMYDVTAALPGYLHAQRAGVEVWAEMTTGLPDLTLVGGDANTDCVVNVFDLVLVAVNYNSSPPTDARADINGNGAVDIFDLVLVCKNVDHTCPQPWGPLHPNRGHATTTAQLRVSPSSLVASMGDWITITLTLDAVENLYGVDVTLAFDPGLLEVVDSDPSQPGIQVVRGDFPDARLGMVVRDVADNEAGTVQYALSLSNPALPVSGSGTLCTITFHPKRCGTCDLSVIHATLVDGDVRSIPVTTFGSEVSLPAERMLYLPLSVKMNGQLQ